MTNATGISEPTMPGGPPSTPASLTMRPSLGRIFMVAVIAVLAAIPASFVPFEKNLDRLFPHDAAWHQYAENRRSFGTDDFVLLTWNEEQLLNQRLEVNAEARDRIQALAEPLSEIPGVLPGSIQHAAGALRFPFERSQIRKIIAGLLIGTDERTVCILCRLQPEEEAPCPRRETIAALRALARNAAKPTQVIGEPIQTEELFDLVRTDSSRLFRAALIVLPLVTWLVTGSLESAAMGGVSGWAAWAFIGLWQWVSSSPRSVLDPIEFPIFMTMSCVFAATRWWTRPQERILAAMLTVGLVIAAWVMGEWWPAIHQTLFHLFVGTMLILAIHKGCWHSRFLGNRTRDSEDSPCRIPTIETPALLLMSLAGAVILLFGIRFISPQSNFADHFPSKGLSSQAIATLEDHLDGAGSWDVSFNVPALLDDAAMDKVRSLAEQLAPHVDKVIAITDSYDLTPERLLFSRLTVDARLGMIERMQPTYVASLYNPARARMRLMLRSSEKPPLDRQLAGIDEVRRLSRDVFPDAEVTGLHVLLARQASHYREAWSRTWLAMIGLMLVSMATIFTNRRPVAMFLVTAAFSLVVMGLSGIRLHTGTLLLAILPCSLMSQAVTRGGFDVRALGIVLSGSIVLMTARLPPLKELGLLMTFQIAFLTGPAWLMKDGRTSHHRS